jgi:translation initiation factor 4G
MSHVDSRGDWGDHLPAGPDGWTVAGSSPARQPSDLSYFGKIKKDQPLTFGPSSVFTNRKPDNKKEPISRTVSSTNTFSMLSSQNAEYGDAGVKCELPYITFLSIVLVLCDDRRV